MAPLNWRRKQIGTDRRIVLASLILPQPAFQTLKLSPWCRVGWILDTKWSLRGQHDIKMKCKSLQLHCYVSVSYSSRASTLILFFNFTPLAPFPIIFTVSQIVDWSTTCTILVAFGALNLKHMSYKRDSTLASKQQEYPHITKVNYLGKTSTILYLWPCNQVIRCFLHHHSTTWGVAILPSLFPRLGYD